MPGGSISDDVTDPAPETVSVEIPRIERVHDLLASISLDEFDPAVDLLPIERTDRFAALEEAVNLFARQLDLTVRDHRGTIRELEASRAALVDQLNTIEEQRAAIRTLSTPVVELWDDVLALPIVGLVDAGRADDMVGELLQRVTQTRARCVIIDVTGVELVDTATAGHFLRLVATTRLVGTFCVITGISPRIAAAMSELGVDMAGTPTLATLKDGLKACFAHLGRGSAATKAT
ncbi:STAS domain-containing protein [Nannocystis radixulma]|uniref:STAS domain-containing protein n=1 Tax=Nannocystis radixulma TaxID=2995305 RepID=A0ABT5B6F7_9BACT|nr:STAS domain-containing protein [Nannocystis radixulma]MDC0669699.1 STAS domain-containing protein [Nannocystis radixulma]